MLRLLLCMLVLSAGFAVPPEGPGPSKSWQLAYVYKGDIWTADGDGRNRKLLVKNGSSPCWSPDKKRIAFARAGDIWVVTLGDRLAKRLTLNWKPAKSERGYSGGRPVDIAWDPNSGHIYFSHWETLLIRRDGEKKEESFQTSTIFEVSPKGGKPLPRLDLFDGPSSYFFSANHHPSFSRNGALMAFVRNGDIWLAMRVKEFEGNSRTDAHHQAWDAWDMFRLLATADYDSANYRGSHQTHAVTHLSVSPDGSKVVYSNERIGGSGFREMILQQLKGPSGFYTDRKSVELGGGLEPCFSPDGKWIAYEGGFGRPEGILAMKVTGKGERLLIPDGEQPAW